MSGAKRRGRASIRRTVSIFFAATLLIAFLMLAGYESVITSYYRGESNLVTRILNPAPSAERSSGTTLKILRLFNAALLSGPDGPTKGPFLDEAATAALDHVIVLRVGEGLAFSSKPLSDDQKALLPAFGAPAPLRSPPRPSPRPGAGDEAKPAVGPEDLDLHLDFRTGTGEAASFFLLDEHAPRRRSYPFSRQLALIVALVLLAADAAAGIFFMLRVTGPLRRVEAAALAMSRGDLDTPVEGGYRFVELERAFEALETMRSEIKELLERERRSEAERRELIANLSHDLRTPLAAIRGYVDGLREGIADTPEKRDRYMRVLGDKIQVLDRMIGEIFLLSTLEARDAPPEFALVDLRAFLADSVEDLRLSAAPGDAVFEVEGLEGPPRLASADPTQLRRVVENLVSNSIRHGGKRPVRIRIGLAELRGESEIFVEDDGRGIAPEDLDRAFERFWRGDPSRRGGGFGLGLAIARRIVEAQGGRIRAERSGSGGARILITLPTAGDGAVAPSEASA